MKKIIDVNYFRDPALTNYLKLDKGNKVVFCDYACMEAYKGNALNNISRTIEIVSKYSEQVIVLKSTRDVIKVTLSGNHLELLEDPVQTKEFKIFCLDVERATQGDAALIAQILNNGKIASDHFAKMRDDAALVALGMGKLSKSFKPDYLSALKKKEYLKPEVIDKIIKDIILLAAFLFQNHPDIRDIPQVPHVKDSYIFRFAISAYFLSLHWICNGGPGNVNRDKLRNDVVDMNYVTYATYFDGLLTNDKKMIEIYQKTCFILEHVFGSKFNTQISGGIKYNITKICPSRHF